MKTFYSNKKRKRGFTLIELMVTMSIISLLSSVVITSVAIAKKKGKNSLHIQNLKQLQLALEQYAVDHDGKYPLSGPPDGRYFTNDPYWTQSTSGGSIIYVDEWLPGIVTGGYISKLPEYIPNSGNLHNGAYGCTPIGNSAPCNPSNAYTYAYACTNRSPVYFYRSDNGTAYKLIVRCPEGAIYPNGPVDSVRPWTRYSVCGFNAQSKNAPGKQNGSGGSNNIACDGF